MWVPKVKDSPMKGRGMEECTKCGRCHRPRQCRPSILPTMYDGCSRNSCGFCQLGVRDKLGRVHQLCFEVLRTRHCSLLSLDTSLMLELITYGTEAICANLQILQVYTTNFLRENDHYRERPRWDSLQNQVAKWTLQGCTAEVKDGKVLLPQCRHHIGVVESDVGMQELKY